MSLSSAQQLNYLRELDQSVARGRPLEEVLRNVLFRACTTLHVPLGLGLIALYDLDGKPISLRWSDSGALSVFENAPNISEGVIGEAIRTNDIQLIRNLKD